MGNCHGTNCCSKESPDELNLKHDIIEIDDAGMTTATTRARPAVPEPLELPRGLKSIIGGGDVLLDSCDSEKQNTVKSTRSIDGQTTEDKESIRKTKNSLEPIKLEKITFKNGTTYEGQWLLGQKSGDGVQVWSDGSFYKGNWLCGKAQGGGRLQHPSGEFYDGQWDLNRANGQGSYIHSSGARFFGSWKNDQQHGFGKEIWPDGTQYEGEYVEGKKHGKGRLVFADSSVYEGQFVRGDIEGFGEYTWPDSRVYRGQWQESKMHGFGRILWKDGRKFEGQYCFDKKHGFGVFSWPDSKKYEGLWKDGLQDGLGVYTTSKGFKRLGSMNQGKCVEWLDGDRSHDGDFKMAGAFTQIDEYAKNHATEYGINSSDNIIAKYSRTQVPFPMQVVSLFT